MKIKKILSVLLTLCLFVNVSFAFDPYADEEVEKKSYKKLYYGIALTLLGGFLAYDGFSLEKVDVSKPSVDFLTVSHSEWVQTPVGGEFSYQLRSGLSLNNVKVTDPDVEEITDEWTDYTKYEILKPDGKAFNPPQQTYEAKYYDKYSLEPNFLYNNGNVDLRNITIEVRYKTDENYIGAFMDEVKDDAGETQSVYRVVQIDKDGNFNDEGVIRHLDNEGFHVAETKSSYSTDTEKVINKKYESTDEYSITLAKGESLSWQDIWEYGTAASPQPVGDARSAHVVWHKGTGDQSGKEFYNDGTTGLNLGKDSAVLMEVRVKLEKNKQYTPIYETRHKSDLEGVAGVFIGIAGIYFIIDHFFDMHKFNAYAKRHHLNLRVTTASNQYKLMLQKRI